MAFTLDIPADVITASRSVTQNLGNRGDGSDGTKDQQFIGVLGENFIRHYCGLPYMSAQGFDGGYDIELLGFKFDIKTMGRTVTPRLDFVNNFIASQSKFQPDAYIFVSVNKNTWRATVCGWIMKNEFLHRATLYKKGDVRTRSDNTQFQLKADTYEIYNHQLNYSATSFPELFCSVWAFMP